MSVSRVRENLTHGSTRRREETNASRSHRAAPSASRRPYLGCLIWLRIRSFAEFVAWLTSAATLREARAERVCPAWPSRPISRTRSDTGPLGYITFALRAGIGAFDRYYSQLATASRAAIIEPWSRATSSPSSGVGFRRGTGM